MSTSTLFLATWLSQWIHLPESLAQNPVLKWLTQKHVRTYEGGRNYLWLCPLLTFIYPGVDSGSPSVVSNQEKHPLKAKDIVVNGIHCVRHIVLGGGCSKKTLCFEPPFLPKQTLTFANLLQSHRREKVATVPQQARARHAPAGKPQLFSIKSVSQHSAPNYENKTGTQGMKL